MSRFVFALGLHDICGITSSSDLERCGIRCYSLEDKVEKLAWFVGGDPAKIRELQSKLNELGIGDRLEEDGVYGKKTLAAWDKFSEALRGPIPILAWVDPLQSKHTGIYSKQIGPEGAKFSSLQDFSARSNNKGKGIAVFRADVRDSIPSFFHINTVEGRSIKKHQYRPTERQRKNINKWNHKEISENTYNALKNFDGTAKKIRIGGRILAATGIVLDILELHQTIEIDKHDADRKIGKATYSEIASIGGSWAVGALGAKGGAMAGAALGTAVFPGIGTAIGGAVGGAVLGVIGSFGGDMLGRHLIDITMVE